MSDTAEAYKRAAAERAVDWVSSGMLVGLGTGSTAVWAVRRCTYRNPPSTTKMCPVMKLALSDARKTAAPTSSSVFPNRRIGVRSNSSCPRGVPSSSSAFRSVRNTPGAIAFTQTPECAHSKASDFVSDATAALLAA